MEESGSGTPVLWAGEVVIAPTLRDGLGWSGPVWAFLDRVLA